MYPARSAHLDIEAISGILGSISIACWVVVFSPQIIENFRRSSADGLSLVFIVVWLLGDVFNIVGAILQGVLPTMIILAVYYTVADIILLLQCFYYRGLTLSDTPVSKPGEVVVETEEQEDYDDEDRPLLTRDTSPVRYSTLSQYERRGSGGSFSDHLYAVDGTHLSPATPLVPPPREAEAPASSMFTPKTGFQSLIFNTGALIVVCGAGVFGWWLSTGSAHRRHQVRSDNPPDDDLHFDILGQVFGYLCAVFYLGSRLPQLLLNYRRKSTEGVSMLFFLFACVGNLTYVLSIFAFEPACARVYTVDGPYSHGCHPGEYQARYGEYILVNLSWLIGSAGTLLLDGAIFAQFWIYRGSSPK